MSDFRIIEATDEQLEFIYECVAVFNDNDAAVDCMRLLEQARHVKEYAPNRWWPPVLAATNNRKQTQP